MKAYPPDFGVSTQRWVGDDVLLAASDTARAQSFPDSPTSRGPFVWRPFVERLCASSPGREGKRILRGLHIFREGRIDIEAMIDRQDLANDLLRDLLHALEGIHPSIEYALATSHDKTILTSLRTSDGRSIGDMTLTFRGKR